MQAQVSEASGDLKPEWIKWKENGWYIVDSSMERIILNVSRQTTKAWILIGEVNTQEASSKRPVQYPPKVIQKDYDGWSRQYVGSRMIDENEDRRIIWRGPLLTYKFRCWGAKWLVTIHTICSTEVFWQSR